MRQDLFDTHTFHQERPTLTIHRRFWSSTLRHHTLHHMLCLPQTRIIQFTTRAFLLMPLSSLCSFRSTYFFLEFMSFSSLLTPDLHHHQFIHHHMLHHHHHLIFHLLTYMLVC
ncbi:hypothetical protein Hanom_Chr06g00546341 [Helianthus anomalus]